MEQLPNTSEHNPIDTFFGAMLSSGTETQFEYFHCLKPQWFTIRYHKDLYDCLNYHVDNGDHFNLVTAATWFKDNARFSATFNAVSLSRLVSKIGYANAVLINSCISQIVFDYFFQASFLFHNKVGQKLNANSFDLDELRTEIDKFQLLIDEDYLEESELSNEDLIDGLIEDHEKAKSGEVPGVRLGFRSLWHVIVELVDFMVIAARPSMGKTAFALSSIYIQCFILGLDVAFFSIEMSKKQIMRRLCSLHTGIPEEVIKLGGCNDDELQKIADFKCHPMLKKLTIYEGSHKPSDIIRKTSLLRKKVDLKAVWIDYLQKLSPERKGMQLREAAADASNQMKNLSMNLGIPTIALAQLSRSVETRGGDKRPMLSDLKETGDIEQDASIVAFLYRPEYYGLMSDEAGESNEGIGEFILAKYRGSALVITRMQFIGEQMKWQDPERKDITHAFTGNKDFDKKSNDIPF